MRGSNVYLFSDVKISFESFKCIHFCIHFDQVGRAENCFKFVVVYEEYCKSTKIMHSGFLCLYLRIFALFFQKVYSIIDRYVVIVVIKNHLIPTTQFIIAVSQCE